MKVTNAIVWDHRGEVPEGGIGQLEVRITVNRKTKYIGAGVKCRRSEWVAGRVVNCVGASQMNERLAMVYEKVLAMVNEAIAANREIDTKAIKEAVWQVNESVSDKPVFLEWVEEQIPQLAISEGTRKHYEPLITRLYDFGRMRRWQDVTVANIMAFDGYLHTVMKPVSDEMVKRGVKPERLSDAGIYNYHKCLKALLNRAFKMEIIDMNPYDRLKGQFKRGEKENPEYLTEDEMRTFEAMVLPAGSALDVAHDLFVFQMYTGLSFSDMMAFDMRDYKWDGSAWVRIGERIKTGVPYVSSLLPPVVKILEKYDWEVPRMNNADYNHQLKALGLMAGIKTRLHSHLARHTFATYMLRNGAKIENVSRMLGHTNITQTQRYAKVLAESVREEFGRVAAKMGAATNHPERTAQKRRKKKE